MSTMISPSNLLKRLGLGGLLVPFLNCVCVYFASQGEPEAPGVAALAAKCAPVLALLLPLSLRLRSDDYAQRLALGLMLSALGDALLMWPRYFVAGMCAFALAHVAYISAFRDAPRAPGAALAVLAATAAYCSMLNTPEELRWAVPLYALVLGCMAWRGVARGGAARGGALLFLASDAVLGYHLFVRRVPHKQLVVMSTYYTAQLLITLSAFEGRHYVRRASRHH